MKPKSILMSSFGALLIMISVRESSIDFSKTNQTVGSVEPTAVIHKTSPTTNFQLMAVKHETSSALPPVSKVEMDFSYLKFNVSDFETSETGSGEMPEEADFAFLKFNVSDYIETETEIGMLPEDSDFDYLKFDVNNYATSLYDEEELPSTGLDYLKFDIQKYMQNDSIGEIKELPEADKH